ncbi:MAG TPA: 3' terminal RNA ribose 2'-O-methyltransferase Hen1 [Fimbriimonadaceae bacterium]|nr:3' terminal RNA ribose 2'-O-methyltransferase Hen1 [Fimbriimonadaceae bacterium]
MLLTITTTHHPATDLGFLLHKNPQRTHVAELTFGKAYVFYPEAGDDRCTAALLIDVDPVKLVRGRRGPSGEGGLFDSYVNDRPYAASSFLSSAILEFFSTAMGGRSKERQELADQAIPLEIRIASLPCRSGEAFLSRLFQPLGYEIEATRLPLDERFPDWGEGRYFDVVLRATKRIADALAHLYVLIPVLDNEKHYWVDKQEIDKLLNRGKTWLAGHPAREEIARRYLRHQKQLTREALARLTAEDGDLDPDEREQENASVEEAVERPLSLHDQRLHAVLAALKSNEVRRVVDLGCGEGRLMSLLIKDKQFERIVGMDVSYSTLEKARRYLKIDRLPPKMAERLELIHGSLVYRDRRIEGFDGAAVVEVIEHLDAPRLAVFERVLFEFARPGIVVMTTPNREYNVLFESLNAGQFRHRDHRFEWTRAEFEAWASGIAGQYGYGVKFLPIGPIHEEHGAPSQMAIFARGEG